MVLMNKLYNMIGRKGGQSVAAPLVSEFGSFSVSEGQVLNGIVSGIDHIVGLVIVLVEVAEPCVTFFSFPLFPPSKVEQLK